MLIGKGEGESSATSHPRGREKPPLKGYSLITTEFAMDGELLEAPDDERHCYQEAGKQAGDIGTGASRADVEREHWEQYDGRWQQSRMGHAAPATTTRTITKTPEEGDTSTSTDAAVADSVNTTNFTTRTGDLAHEKRTNDNIAEDGAPHLPLHTLRSDLLDQQPQDGDQQSLHDAEDILLSPLDSVLQQNSTSTVRWTMTAVAVLFCVAGFLTILAASSYRFFLTCVWITLICMFAAFVWFVQQTVLCAPNSGKRGRGRVFHPTVHAVAGWFQQQVQDFRDDFRAYYDTLMIDNEAAFDNYHQHGSDDGMMGDGAKAENKANRKSRSALFRVVFKPVMNIAFRGRRKRRKKRKQDQEAAAAAAAATGYAPPPTAEATKETELV